MIVRPAFSVVRPVCAACGTFARRRVTTNGARSLHQTPTFAATPLPYPTVPGPTPEPPHPPTVESDARVIRKKNQLEAVRAVKAANAAHSATKSGSTLQKRFWKDVSVKEIDDGLQIFLDARPIRTASKQVLTLPKSKRALAAAIALEWDLLVSAQQALKNHYIPLTSLASRAIDIEAADALGKTKIREDTVTMLMRYLATDTLLCWAPEKSAHDPTAFKGEGDESKPSLRKTQIAAAEPIIAFLKTHLFPGLDIAPILDEESIIPRSQSQLTEQVIHGWLHGLPSFELAAVERAVLASKSLLIAVRLLVEWSSHFSDLHSLDQHRPARFGIQEAAAACSAEVKWQTDMWGEVEDTHDVEREDLARQLGSVILLVS